MSSRLHMSGLRELITELTNAPDAIRDDGMAIVRDEVEGAADDIRAAYPTGPTGRLKRGVKVDFPSRDILFGQVKSTAPESHLYEFGTQTRQSGSGANRGAVRPHPVTVPIAKKRRRRMFERLKRMLAANGYQVSGG